MIVNALFVHFVQSCYLTSRTNYYCMPKSKQYKRLDEGDAVRIALLDKSGKSIGEIARYTGIPKSTVYYTLKGLEEGRVPGRKQWTLKRFNDELHRRSREAVYSWQGIVEDSHALVKVALQDVAKTIDADGATLQDAERLSKIAINAVAVLEKLQAHTSDKVEEQARTDYDSMTGSELVDALMKVQEKLKSKATQAQEAQVVEST